jgi:site-specific DNA-methyltransferase (adenine-specific)
MDWKGKNLLCFGDNLGFLKDAQLFPDECIDLIYLDPPFNSQQSYNVLFKEAAGTPAAAQIKAFEDTWTWDQGAAAAFQGTVETAPPLVSQAMQVFKTMLGRSDLARQNSGEFCKCVSSFSRSSGATPRRKMCVNSNGVMQ